jgi:hypothetical protein
MELVVNATPQPLYSRERATVPIVKEFVWAERVFWTGAGNFTPWTVKPVASCYNLYKI